MNGNLSNTKTCPNCGVTNLMNASFCIKCGATFGNSNVNIQNNSISNEFNNMNNNVDNSFNNVVSNTNDVNSQHQNNNFNDTNNANNVKVSTGKLDYIKYLLGSFIKPYDTYKANENLLSFKNSSILAFITVGVITIINLFSTMLSAVRHKNYFTDKVTWNWENLGNVEYFKTIALSLLVYAGIIFAIAGLYYLGSLVIKKNAKFSNLVAATTTAMVPLVGCSLLISPILKLIYSPLATIATVVGFIYAFVALVELMNDAVTIDNKNIRIYYHMVCLSTVIIVGGYIAYKILVNMLYYGFKNLI